MNTPEEREILKEIRNYKELIGKYNEIMVSDVEEHIKEQTAAEHNKVLEHITRLKKHLEKQNRR